MNRGVRIIISGTDKFSVVLGKVQHGLDIIDKKGTRAGLALQGFGLGIAGLGGGAAYATGLTSVVGDMVRMEHGLVKLQNIGNLTDEVTHSIGRSLRMMSSEVNQTQGELLEGLTTLIERGMDPTMALGLIQNIGKVATAEEAGINDLAVTAYTGINTFKVQMRDVPAMFEQLTQSAKDGSFELANMAAEFPNIIAGSRAIGLQGLRDIPKIGAALQIAMLGAGSPEEAANNFKNFLAKILSSETRNKLAMVGVDIVKVMQDAAASPDKDVIEEIMKTIIKTTGGDMNKVADVFNERSGIVGDINQMSKTALLFSDMQVSAFLRPMIQNLDQYREKRDRAANADGNIQRDFNRKMKTTIELWKLFKIQISSTGFENLSGPILAINALLRMTTSTATGAKVAFFGMLGAIGLGGALIGVGTLLRSMREIKSLVEFIRDKEVATLAIRVASLAAERGIALAKIAGQVGPWVGLALLGAAAGYEARKYLKPIVDKRNKEHFAGRGGMTVDEKEAAYKEGRYNPWTGKTTGGSQSVMDTLRAFSDSSLIPYKNKRIALDVRFQNAPPGTKATLPPSISDTVDLSVEHGIRFSH